MRSPSAPARRSGPWFAVRARADPPQRHRRPVAPRHRVEADPPRRDRSRPGLASPESRGRASRANVPTNETVAGRGRCGAPDRAAAGRESAELPMSRDGPRASRRPGGGSWIPGRERRPTSAVRPVLSRGAHAQQRHRGARNPAPAGHRARDLHDSTAPAPREEASARLPFRHSDAIPPRPGPVRRRARRRMGTLIRIRAKNRGLRARRSVRPRPQVGSAPRSGGAGESVGLIVRCPTRPTHVANRSGRRAGLASRHRPASGHRAGPTDGECARVPGARWIRVASGTAGVCGFLGAEDARREGRPLGRPRATPGCPARQGRDSP